MFEDNHENLRPNNENQEIQSQVLEEQRKTNIVQKSWKRLMQSYKGKRSVCLEWRIYTAMFWKSNSILNQTHFENDSVLKTL